ncbi:MAG: hypothetical protein AAGF74_10965 [Pseudomonadota bacterium]
MATNPVSAANHLDTFEVVRNAERMRAHYVAASFGQFAVWVRGLFTDRHADAKRA